MDGSANSDEFFSRKSSSENNAKSNISSAKRHSKTRSKVWEKVAWFTRKTRTGKESKTNSPVESRNVWKSPCVKRSQRNKSESCLEAGEQFAVASCPNFAKKKTKSSLRKARSFSYLKRKKLGHYNVKAESNKEETKENDNPFRCQTATGTFYDFESTGRRNSGNPSCCSILNEMAREINFEQRGQVRESAKSSLSLPMSLLSIGENPANDLNSTLHSATKQSESRSTRGRMGPMYNSWPRKKRNFRPNNYYEAFSPPLKQKRICNLRKTATFSGFDAHKLGASEDKLWKYRVKAVKSSPVLDNLQNQIKNQNGLTIGVVHVFKTPSNTRFSHSLNNMKESLVHNTNRSSRDDNLPDSSSPSHFKEIDLGDGLVCSQSCSNLSGKNNEKWKIDQNTPLSSDHLVGCTSTEAVTPVDDLKLSINDPGKCLENISQKEHSPEVLQENLSYKSDKKPCDERNLNVELVPSCKLPITDHQASSMQLEVICEIPDNLSEMEGDNELSLSNSSSKDLNPQAEIINDTFTSENQVHKMESLDSSICCIKIEDQATDFSESKHDGQSNLKEIPILTFSEANKEAIDEPLDIVQNTMIKDVINESLTPPIDCTVVKNQELSDIVLPDSSVSANTTMQDEQEDNIKLDASVVVDKSDKESLATSPLSSQLDLTDSCHVFDVTSLQLSSENLLKEKQPKVDGIHFKHQTETMLKWFSEFNDAQRNSFIRRLLEQCELPQMHMLSVIMEPALHKTCPPNCQDMLLWLPLSVTETVLLYLDPVSLCRCGLVNRFWNSLVSRPLIWKTLCRSNEWQLSRNSSKIQHAKYTLPDGTVQWKKMFSERFLLRKNWLNGRCKVRTFEGHTQGISCVQFDDTQIVSGSSDKTIKVWDLSRDDSHAVLTLAGHSGTVRCLNLNGNRLVSGSVDRSIKVWDLSFKSYWSGASCKVTMVGHMHTVRCLQVDDEKVVSGSYDKTLKVWDIKTGHCKLTLRGHNAAVLCVQFDDSMIVSGSYDNSIKVWSLKEGECLMTLTGHHDAVTCLNLTQDGRKVISGSLDHNLKFWDLATGKCIGTLDWIRSEGHTGVIRCLQSDSWKIVSAGDDKTLKMWSLETGQRLLTLRCHTDGVTCLQFNDYTIVSGSYDKTVKVWTFTPEHEFLNPS